MHWVLTLTGENELKFIGRTDAEAETSILWPPDPKSWLIGKVDDEWWVCTVHKCQRFLSSLNNMVMPTVTWSLEYSPFLLLNISVVVSRTQPPRSSSTPTPQWFLPSDSRSHIVLFIHGLVSETNSRGDGGSHSVLN